MKNIKPVTFMLLAAMLTACAASGQKRALAPKLTNTGSPVLHAINSDELRQLMRRMNNMMYERNLTSQEMDVQQRQAVSQVIGAANELEQDIDGILATMPKLNLDEGEQKVFRSLAVNLREEAYKLKFQAEAHQLDDIPVTLEKMSATCTSCHQLFRDFTKQGGQQ